MEIDALRRRTQMLLASLQSSQSNFKKQLGIDRAPKSVEATQHNDVRVITANPQNFPDHIKDTSNRIIEMPTKDRGHHRDRGHDYSSSYTRSTSGSDQSEDGNLRKSKAYDEASQATQRRRKIIDDNIMLGPSPQQEKYGGHYLNYDLSDDDDIDMLKKVVRNQLEIDMALEDSRKSRIANIDQLEKQRRLLDSGNDRKHCATIRQLSTRPKSVVFDETAPQAREKFGSSMSRISAVAEHSEKYPLLGYDIIAGLLDNESQLVDRSDAYYDELNEFRRVNKEECVGTTNITTVLDLTRPISPEIKDPGHTCIHGYNINDRLYPEPLSEGQDGDSQCPVCLSRRGSPTREEPSYVRVSIPRSSLQAPYRIKPHRRRSFDDTDNFALSKHCLAGWECSKPSMLPTASTIDLKQATQGLQERLSNTVQDLEAVTASYKKIPAPPKTLLDESRNLRAEAQFSIMNMTRANSLHSTVY